ncbi:MAG: PHP domain-containing protein, partial [Gemmatimonadota bacterium]
MDLAGDGIPPLNAGPPPERRRVDLHTHSTASDGADTPAGLVARAAAKQIAAIALTDHDTVAGVPEAIAAGERVGVRVIAGCEFSVAVSWGEMHLLGYFLPADSPRLADFLARSRDDRARRVRVMVQRLQRLGLAIEEEMVLTEAQGGSLGRPHVARALLRLGAVSSVNEAFDRYIARGRPAFVDKTLPSFRE